MAISPSELAYIGSKAHIGGCEEMLMPSRTHMLAGLPTGLCQASWSLLIYREIWNMPVFQAFNLLARELDKAARDWTCGEEATAVPGREPLAVALYDFISKLIPTGLDVYGPSIGSLWQEHLLNSILGYQSPLLSGLFKEQSQEDKLFVQLLEHDLTILDKLFWAFDDGLANLIQKAMGDIPLPADDILSRCYGGSRKGQEDRNHNIDTETRDVPPTRARQPVFSTAEEILTRAAYELKSEFYTTRIWADLAPHLMAYYRRFGIGELNRSAALIWQCPPGNGLVGIAASDPIQLQELSGYTEQVEKVVDNTKRFLQDLPAHNLLLYGDRGTGKSSTVKGLVHRFVDRGLRLVEMGRNELGGLRELMESLSQLSLRFIVFIDDLSFEEDETEFKALKSTLEGSVMRQPENVLIYATSNRRHLIEEAFSETAHGDGVRWQDTVQEKLSLSDRFGLTIIYPSPDQKTYLGIVEHLAYLDGIRMDRDLLRSRALQWTLWHNERSGRTARQFVNELKAEQEMES